VPSGGTRQRLNPTVAADLGLGADESGQDLDRVVRRPLAPEPQQAAEQDDRALKLSQERAQRAGAAESADPVRPDTPNRRCRLCRAEPVAAAADGRQDLLGGVVPVAFERPPTATLATGSS
jgi:hypothetical protein